MDLHDIIGKIIIVKLADDYIRDNNELFQLDDSASFICAKSTHADNLGVWIEKPDWQSNNHHHSFTIEILIKWEYIKSVGIMPNDFLNDKGLPLSKKVIPIGFRRETM